MDEPVFTCLNCGESRERDSLYLAVVDRVNFANWFPGAVVDYCIKCQHCEFRDKGRN